MCSWSRMVHPITIICSRSFVNVSCRYLEYSNVLLQVQRIKNAFTVEVYEGHARIALEQVSQFSWIMKFYLSLSITILFCSPLLHTAKTRFVRSTNACGFCAQR